jgi:hypothetical protein
MTIRRRIPFAIVAALALTTSFVVWRRSVPGPADGGAVGGTIVLRDGPFLVRSAEGSAIEGLERLAEPDRMAVAAAIDEIRRPRVMWAYVPTSAEAVARLDSARVQFPASHLTLGTLARRAGDTAAADAEYAQLLAENPTSLAAQRLADDARRARP